MKEQAEDEMERVAEDHALKPEDSQLDEEEMERLRDKQGDTR